MKRLHESIEAVLSWSLGGIVEAFDAIAQVGVLEVLCREGCYCASWGSESSFLLRPDRL